MKIFNGSELVFSQTYFPSQSNHILEVKTDSTVRTLALTEVPETGGSFSFLSDELGFSNRIIFWRTESSRLYLNEVNSTRQYPDSSLYIDFAPSVIIQGTSILLCRDLLLLIVPTQSCIHRFKIRLTGKNSVDQSFTNRSVLSFFPKQEHLPSCHDCHYFSNSVIASSVDVTLDKVGNTFCSIVVNKSQVMLLNMRIQPTEKNGFEETLLKEGFGLNRLWNSSEQESTILNSASIMLEDELYVLSVHEDGRLKIWAVNSNSLKNSYNLASFLKQEAAVEVENVQMKFVKAYDEDFLVVKVQLVRRTKFLFFEFNDGDLSLSRVISLEAKSIVDFLVTKTSVRKQEFALWACNRESFESGTPSGMFQPYSIKKCFVSLNGDFESIWESIETTASNIKHVDVINQSNIDAIKKRILGGETYSFEMVERAIQTLCKSPGVKFEYMDWPSLSNFVDGFIKSGQFKTLYLSKEDQHTFSATNNLEEDGFRAAKKKFWTTLDKYCSQFQEQLISPIVLWHCPVLGLVGCIQHARFTVYLEPDQTMKGFVQHNKQTLLKLLNITEGFLEDDCDFRGVVAHDLEFLISHLDVLLNVLKWFTERTPESGASDLIPLKSEYIYSSFSTGFMSAALRHRILHRLLFAKCICTLVALVEAHLDKAGKSADIAWKVSNARKPINQIRDFYYNLYQSLSTRFFCPRDPSPSAISLNLAEAFYRSGPLVPNVPPLDEDFDVEDDMWNMEQEAKAVTTNFVETVTTAVHLTIISLWPNSTSMSFPQFLARNLFYEHLRNYCELNEPYLSNLTYAFNFYKGISLSGLGFPQDADVSFQEALQGIDLGDEALNRALCFYSLKTYPFKHNIRDFYAATMKIFSLSNHGEYVIRSGQLAIRSAEKFEDIAPDPELMSFIYTKMFSQYVVDKKYNEAVKMLHNNPLQTIQLSCLRSLIGTLLDLNETKTLINLPFITLGDKVSEMLENRCKSQNPLTEHGLFNTVYSFYIKRFEYKKAAQILYSLVWKLKFVPQSRDVLEKRCRFLACVNQTMELLGDDKATLEIDVEAVLGRGVMEDNLQENFPTKKLQMSKKDILEEFVLLEARLALCDAETYDSGPPVDKDDVFKGVIIHKNYDLAFVLHRIFGLRITELIRALTLECLQLGFQEPKVTPIWVVHNRRFVDNMRSQVKLPQHWKVLLTYVDLSLTSPQSAQDDSFVLRNILEIFLERGLEVPEWLTTRYIKANVRDFLAELIEYDQISLALSIVSNYLEQMISTRPKLEHLHNVPFVLINNLLILAEKQNTPKTLEESKRTQGVLRKVTRAFKFIQSV